MQVRWVEGVEQASNQEQKNKKLYQKISLNRLSTEAKSQLSEYLAKIILPIRN